MPCVSQQHREPTTKLDASKHQRAPARASRYHRYHHLHHHHHHYYSCHHHLHYYYHLQHYHRQHYHHHHHRHHCINAIIGLGPNALHGVRWIHIVGHHAPTLYNLADIYGLDQLEVQDAMVYTISMHIMNPMVM